MIAFFARIGVLLLAVGFSVLALHGAARMHPDEAFYLTFARNAAVKGDWLMTGEPVDKPPLTFYANALALAAFAVTTDANGVHQLDALQGEFAGRMPAFFMSILLVALVMRLAHTLSHKRRAVIFSGCVAALSPLRIVFAATAFTDLPMLTLATAAVWMAAEKRWMWAGWWFALAFAAKPQAVFLLPLIIGLRLHGGNWRGSWRFLIPGAIVGVALYGWDLLRMAQGAESFWILGQQRYPALAWVPVTDWSSRATELWQTIGFLYGYPALTACLLAAMLITLRRQITLLLAAWLAALLAAHILFSLNLYDRNLIVILPAAALLAGELLAQKSIWRIVAGGLIAALMMVAGWQAAARVFPIGGDDGTHDGIDQLAAWLNARPLASVIYDRWLDWELDYYMGTWTDKRRVYYHTPQELAAGAAQLSEQGVRYFVAPSAEDVTLWLQALQDAGFQIWLEQTLPRFDVYAMQPPL